MYNRAAKTRKLVEIQRGRATVIGSSMRRCCRCFVTESQTWALLSSIYFFLGRVTPGDRDMTEPVSTRHAPPAPSRLFRSIRHSSLALSS
jgi:hypothetical protein